MYWHKCTLYLNHIKVFNVYYNQNKIICLELNVCPWLRWSVPERVNITQKDCNEIFHGRVLGGKSNKWLNFGCDADLQILAYECFLVEHSSFLFCKHLHNHFEWFAFFFINPVVSLIYSDWGKTYEKTQVLASRNNPIKSAEMGWRVQKDKQMLWVKTSVYCSNISI